MCAGEWPWPSCTYPETDSTSHVSHAALHLRLDCCSKTHTPSGVHPNPNPPPDKKLPKQKPKKTFPTEKKMGVSGGARKACPRARGGSSVGGTGRRVPIYSLHPAGASGAPERRMSATSAACSSWARTRVRAGDSAFLHARPGASGCVRAPAWVGGGQRPPCCRGCLVRWNAPCRRRAPRFG
jgi:hypothetical protein